MLYAIAGMPLFLAGLAGLGKTISAKMSHICSKIFTRLSFQPSFHAAACYKLLFCSLGGGIVWLVIPAWLIAMVEGWSYLDAFYHVFITVSTIGFGDIIPGEILGRAAGS